MIRYYLTKEYDPDIYTDYKFIRVEIPINKNTGYNNIAGYENVFVLVNKNVVDRYNSNTCEMKKCVGILSNDSKYYHKLKAGMIIVFDMCGEKTPLVREDWLLNHLN